jgi:hypothetical protein
MGAVGAKFRRKNEFATTFWDRQLSAMLRRPRPRGAGEAMAPAILRLEPGPGAAPSDRPVVRIFLGCEPAQARAERVFVWSIVQVRDPSLAYEIHVMKDLAGFDRRMWKTGFTNYRYAIPHFAGGTGRAIYNDVDQIYLADPSELFDTDMGGKGALSITERETSVMLLDCAKLADVWSLAGAQRVASHRHFRTKLTAAGLWGPLEPF